MRTALLLLIFVSSFAQASDCELALTTSLAKVTAAALTKGDISLEEVRELAMAGEPINPLRFRTPGSSSAALSRFYSAMTAKHNASGDWESVRAELKKILEVNGIRAAQVSDAREDTGKMPLFELFQTIEGHRKHNFRFYRLRDGRMIYEYWEGGVHIFHELGVKEPVATIKGSGWLRENEMGHPEWISLQASPKTWLESLRHPRLKKESGTLTDLDTKATRPISRLFGREGGNINYVVTGHEPGSEIVVRGDTLFTPLTANRPFPREPGWRQAAMEFVGETGPALQALIRSVSDVTLEWRFVFYKDGEWHDYTEKPFSFNRAMDDKKIYILKDGRMAATARSEGDYRAWVTMPFKGSPEASFFLETRYRETNQVQLVESVDDRVFVVTASSNSGPFKPDRCVEVFEPEKTGKEKSIFQAEFEEPVEVTSFTRQNRFYVLVSNPRASEMYLFEPLYSDKVLARAKVPGRLGGVYLDKDGEAYLVQEVGDSTEIRKIFVTLKSP